MQQKVTFGATKFDGSGDMTKEVRIVDFHMHHGFVHGTFENDICLLQLSENVQSNPNIAPACLPQERLPDNFNGRCFIAGWGTMQEGKIFLLDPNNSNDSARL